jgi:hypothetical protein
MKYKKTVFIFIIAVLSSACSHMPGFANEDVRKTRVAEKSAWDLECDQKLIKVTKINDTTYGAEGCGHRVSYLMDKCSSGLTWGNNASVCTAVLNSIDNFKK